ncbi:MAG: PilZ domain-containing protein [Deltaproteobacteria bacterium]|jgi:hypothetical protein|nr:PilZ domain-containing protein [Deltaproteobacteria bacterium]
MYIKTNRVYSRSAHEAPILYTTYDTENYYHARMFNSSLGGLYFESERALQPESDICIKMVTHPSEEPGPETFKACRARVKWCQKRNKSGIFCYGVGIQYLAKSPTVYGEKAHGLGCSCDLCGEKVPSGEILENEDFIYLCRSCFNYLAGLPEGNIKESIKEFLIGNVL